MNIDIKHKNSGHVIIIKDQAFKANEAGRFDATDVWQTLKLPKGKQPGKWKDTKKAKKLHETENIGSVKVNRETHLMLSKRAFIAYAGWVSDEFEDMVYDAFEAILEMPEVAALVADKMASLGNAHSADILKRMTFNDKHDWSLKAPHKNTQKGLRAAVAKGNLTPQRAAELGLKAR